jgi:hypothetical protein
LTPKVIAVEITLVALRGYLKARRATKTREATVSAYRFYLLDRGDHIRRAREGVCDTSEDVKRMAEQFLLLEEPSITVTVEVWDRATMVYRLRRAEVGPVTS